MKRKIFIALAVLIPIVLFVALKRMVYWRTIQIGNAQIYGYAKQLEVSPDGKYVAAATENGVQVFDIEKRVLTLEKRFEGGASDDLSVHAIAFSKSGNELFVVIRFSALGAQSYGKIERYPLDGIKNRAALQKVSDGANFLESTALRATGDGKYLQLDGRFWDLTNGKMTNRKPFSVDSEAFSLPVLSRDGSKARYMLNERNFAEFDLNLSEIRKIPIQNPKHIENVELSRYGDYVFMQSRNGPWVIRDFQTGRKLWNFPPRITFEKNFIVNADQTQILITTGQEWQVRSLRTGELLNSIKSREVAKIGAWSVDGNTIFWEDSNAMLWKQHIR